MSDTLQFDTPNGPLTTKVRRLLCAGYTGRTREAVLAHIEELKALGIGVPPHIPMLFPIMPELLTQATSTKVMGFETAPEVEYVIFRHEGRDYVTVGSDQTDTVMEAQTASLAKNLCFKSVGTTAWPVDEVAAHWDRLELTLTCNGKVMQHGALAEMMTPDQLRAFVADHDGQEHEGRMIFSGTMETHGRFPREAVSIEIKLGDPVLGRTIGHSYTVEPMADIFKAAI